MQRFNTIIRKLSAKNTALFFVLAIFGVSSGAAVFTNVLTANAANTYTYAGNNSKIVLTKPSGKTYTLEKYPIQSNGKVQYNGSVPITGPDGKNPCIIGILIVVSSGDASGVISAPAEFNGLAGSGAAGVAYTPSCPRDFAAKSSEYNQSITIAGAGSTTTAPANPETIGQKEGIVSTYSKTSNQPKASIARTVGNSPSSDSKDISWNTGASVGEARWQDLVAGTSYKFCVTPTGVFDTQDCKTATKEYGKPLLVAFGSFDTSYNPTGKQVTITVHMSIPAAPSATTYGPIPLTITNMSTGKSAGTGQTEAETIGKPEAGGVTVAQTINFTDTIDSIEPGIYKVCVTGSTKLCSAQFTKEVNAETTAEITIGVDDAKTFLYNANKKTCGIEGIGWIVCPLMTFMGDLLNNAFDGLKDNFLNINASLFSVDSGTYTAWGIFRNFANVAFVIVFLIIIFSQMTGLGVSNYGVKKMLPRIVIAAILVNISYFVCQIAVDLSNILGVSLKGVFDSIASTAKLQSSTDASKGGFGVVEIVAAVAAAGVAAYFALGIMLPILIGAVVSVLGIVIILIARKAFIVLLIILSPLAFVAFLLPNTESLFTKWRKAFMSLLILFPIISIVFGGASLASQILVNSSPSGNDVAQKQILQIVALGVAALPFFVVPFLLKSSLNAVGGVGGKINGFANKLGGGLGKAGSKGFANTALSRGRELRKQSRAAYRNEKFAKAVAKGGARAVFARGPNIIGAQKYANAALERNATATSEKVDIDEVKAATQVMNKRVTAEGAGGQDYAEKQLTAAIQSGDSIKTRAAYTSLVSMGAGGVEAARKMVVGSEINSDKNINLSNALKQHIINNHSDMKITDNRQMGWATNSPGARLDGDGHLDNLTDAQIASQTPDSIDSGTLDATRARRILNDVTISPNIKDTQRASLEAKAGGAP